MINDIITWPYTFHTYELLQTNLVMCGFLFSFSIPSRKLSMLLDDARLPNGSCMTYMCMYYRLSLTFFCCSYDNRSMSTAHLTPHIACSITHPNISSLELQNQKYCQQKLDAKGGVGWWTQFDLTLTLQVIQRSNWILWVKNSIFDLGIRKSSKIYNQICNWGSPSEWHS